MSPSTDASAARNVQNVFPLVTHSIDPGAAEEEDTQDDFHMALDTDDEDDVIAEENEHQLREGEAALNQILGEVAERKAT
jgi:hypothetical protein